MNQKAKNFIEKKLIPFILREQGRGFGMSTWCEKDLPVGEVFCYDEVARAIPACGTVACIGGSTAILAGKGTKGFSWNKVPKIAPLLGLSNQAARGLFYNYLKEEIQLETVDFGWPIKFAQRFEKAATPLAKAKVAVALLREVIKTNGMCLDLRK